MSMKYEYGVRKEFEREREKKKKTPPLPWGGEKKEFFCYLVL